MSFAEKTNNAGLKRLFVENHVMLVFSFVLISLLAYVLFYVFMPVIWFGFWGLPICLLLISLLTLLFFKRVGVVLFCISIFLLVIYPIFSTLAFFRSDAYYEQIKVEESVFTKDVTPIALDKIRTVPPGYARYLGEKRLGEDPALGSRAVLGKLSLQQVKGKLYYVGAVEHSGFFRWLRSESTPGYIIISATNERDIRYVPNHKIVYQPGGFFGDYIYRYLYFNGYMTDGLTNCSLELDDDLNPWWVVTVFKKKIGYSGNEAKGVVIVNPETGEISPFYSIKDTPEWVDRIQPSSFIVDQLDNWGLFPNGWWNARITKIGVLQTTWGISLVYGEDGRSYYYTGIQSIGSEGATVGFVLVDTRTKETKLYKQAGASEIRAMRSAEGKVQEKNYKAAAPVLYNINGIPTYFMPLIDKEGLVAMYSFVSVEEYNIVGVGKSVQRALDDYENSLTTRGQSIASDISGEYLRFEGKVLRFANEVNGGDSRFLLIVEGIEDKIFTGTSSVSQELPLTKIGDRVQISFMEGQRTIIHLQSFDNLEITLSSSLKQTLLDEDFIKLKKEKEDVSDGKQADQDWKKLSPAEKAEIMKKQKK